MGKLDRVFLAILTSGGVLFCIFYRVLKEDAIEKNSRVTVESDSS